mmetsp:Transcript_5593/g.4800  ORF Transcript_5593/g.4800 Transcript_5593/m.4800 type:complete len:102 (-) Transcript_5593:369-674(-)
MISNKDFQPEEEMSLQINRSQCHRINQRKLIMIPPTFKKTLSEYNDTNDRNCIIDTSNSICQMTNFDTDSKDRVEIVTEFSGRKRFGKKHDREMWQILKLI